MSSMYSGMSGPPGMSGSTEGMSSMYAMGNSSMMGPGSMYNSSMMGGNPAAKKKDEKTLTRTDFSIQLIWQPPTAETPAPDLQEITQKIREAESQAKGATQTFSEKDIEDASKKESAKVIQQDQARGAAAQAKAGVGAVPPGAIGVNPSAARPRRAGPGWTRPGRVRPRAGRRDRDAPISHADNRP
jgi:hypothetical protein